MYTKPHYLENFLWLLNADELRNLCYSRGLVAGRDKKGCIEVLLNEPSNTHSRDYLGHLPEETIHQVCTQLKRNKAAGKTGKELINYVVKAFARMEWSYYAPLPPEAESTEEEVPLPKESFSAQEPEPHGEELLGKVIGELQDLDSASKEIAEITGQNEAVVKQVLESAPTNLQVEDISFVKQSIQEEEEEDELLTLDLEESKEELAEIIEEVDQNPPAALIPFHQMMTASLLWQASLRNHQTPSHQKCKRSKTPKKSGH